jgi:hypothetical protein
MPTTTAATKAPQRILDPASRPAIVHPAAGSLIAPVRPTPSPEGMKPSLNLSARPVDETLQQAVRTKRFSLALSRHT